MQDGRTVYVEASGRLHFGVLDLRGDSGRWFGGIGAAAPAPTLLVSGTPARALDVEGEDAERAHEFARRFLTHFGIDRGARLHIHRALPPHSGLGSGTQLALAVGRVLAEINGLDVTPSELALAVGRARRSAVGTWTFADGGLVVEGGRRPAYDECGPLVARLFFPPSWRCVVAIPSGGPSMSGTSEEAALASLPPPDQRDVDHVAHLVLMTLLPAVATADLAGFGAALTEIQEITGRWFAPVQGGAFAPGPGAALVRKMIEWGAAGVGQSSWGPAVYGVVEGDAAAGRVAERTRAHLGSAGAVYAGPFPTSGARVWRALSTPLPAGEHEERRA